MNDDDFKDLPDDQLKLIDDICSEFDRNLQTGKICAVDELTSHAPQELQPHIQEELVATEIDFCRQKNDELSAEELQRRFPKVRLARVEELLQESAATADDTANLEVTQVGIEHQGATSSTGLQQIGPYRLEEEIGRGGMGVVYRAIHTKLGKTVALKVLSVSIAVHEEAVARFQREMLAIGAFEHPNIVRATDAGEINGLHYLVMEFVRGADLTSLTRRGLLPPTEAAEIIRQAAIGLQAAFAQGIVHDLDGDEDLDIFLAVQGPNVVYLNDGTGRFTQADFEFPSSHSTDAQIADFDSDGRADIIVSNHGPNRVWLNEGDATFREFGPGMKDCATSSICVGDVDGDGDLDFVSANNGSQTNFVWSNDGHGFFSPIGTIGAEDSTNEIALADLDNDGDLDAVVGNWAENKESLLSQQSFAWMNDGNGVFTDSIAVLDEPTRVAGILTVDLDNNGLPDVFVSNWAEEPDRIIMNRTDSRTARRFDGQQNSIHVPGIPHSDEIN